MSEKKEILDISTRQELRAWLEENHASEKECWVLINRGKSKVEGRIDYLELVEEALCFGWIDSTCKRIEEGTLQRISPRAKRSSWTELNKARCRRLEKLGLMREAGRAVLPDLQSFVIDEEIMNELRSDPLVLKNFNAFPELYKRVRIDNIQSYKKQKELYEQRLQKFIQKTREGEMYGEWNDGGLLE